MKANAARKTEKRKPGRPPKEYSQTERVLELYERLRRREVVRAVAVAAKLGVSRRTIERDILLLRRLRDVPLEKVEEPTPGWRIPEQHRGWSTTRWQVLAIALGARMSGFLSGRKFDVQVRPLVAVDRKADARSMPIDFSATKFSRPRSESCPETKTRCTMCGY